MRWLRSRSMRIGIAMLTAASDVVDRVPTEMPFNMVLEVRP